MSGNQLKKRIVNLSKYKLYDKEMKVLANGLNYAITPDKIPHEDYIVATELAVNGLISSVPQHLLQETLSMANNLISGVVNILTKARPSKQNIGKEDRSLLNSLAKNEDILLLPADKGKGSWINVTIEQHWTKW